MGTFRNARAFSSSDLMVKHNPTIAAELGDEPGIDIVSEMNAKYPDKQFHWAGCNIWRTLEWILPHPPPFHTFEEQPIIKETVGPADIHPRPMNYNPAADDLMDHSYHPSVHQTL